MTYQTTSREEYDAQGKSNNFIAAQEDGRMTVGQAAKLLSKKFSKKVTAKQLETFASEFHHAGRFGGNKAKRVFFLAPEQVARITAEDLDRPQTVTGWVLGFRVERGRYGRKSYQPIVIEAGEIDASRAHRLGDKFHPLPTAEVEEAKAAIGKTLPAYSCEWREAR